MIMSGTRKFASGKFARMRAAEALKILLNEMSAIEIKQIDLGAPGAGREIDILVRVDVYGHSHTLACGLETNGEAHRVRTALDALHDGIMQLPGSATPVIIAPYLSPEAQTLCEERKTGYLDLEGNARLEVDEVFISKRSMPGRASQQASRSAGASGTAARRAANMRGAERETDRSVLEGFPAVSKGLPFGGFRAAAPAAAD